MRRVDVSIHAPREGCDLSTFAFRPSFGAFQFTHPGRGATWGMLGWILILRVSIHAPREGCDEAFGVDVVLLFGFNSRTPGGVRLLVNPFRLLAYQFQFTHPGRGAT